MILKPPAPGRPRALDPAGSGAFMASRSSGRRSHMGLDWLVERAGVQVRAPGPGLVKKVGYMYGDDLSYRYVEAEAECGLVWRVCYLTPLVEPTVILSGGDLIGIALDVGDYYRAKPGHGAIPPPHLHIEVWLKWKKGAYAWPGAPGYELPGGSRARLCVDPMLFLEI